MTIEAIFIIIKHLLSEWSGQLSQIHSRFRDKRRQLGNEIQRLKDDVRGAIAVGRFELIPDIP